MMKHVLIGEFIKKYEYNYELRRTKLPLPSSLETLRITIRGSS